MNEIKKKFKSLKTNKIMKRSLIFAIFALAVFFVGCQDDFVDPAPPVEPSLKYVFVVKSVDTNGCSTLNTGKFYVEKGANFKISMNVQVGYQAVISLNGVTATTENNEYVLKSANGDTSVDVSFEKAARYNLVAKPWFTLFWKTRPLNSSSKEWTNISKAPDETKRQKYVFSKDTLKIYEGTNYTNMVGSMDYQIIGDSIIWGKGGSRVKILQIDESKLVYSFKSPYYYYSETEKKWLPDPSKDGYSEIEYEH